MRTAQRTVEGSTTLNGEVEGDLGALLDDMGVEAFFLVGRELVGQSGRRGEARKGAQEGQEGEEDQHVDGGRREHCRAGCRSGSMDGRGGVGHRQAMVFFDGGVFADLLVEVLLSCCRLRPRIHASRG